MENNGKMLSLLFEKEIKNRKGKEKVGMLFPFFEKEIRKGESKQGRNFLFLLKRKQCKPVLMTTNKY